MKLLIELILVLYCLAITGCAGMGERHTPDMMEIASYQNEPEGFRGIKWGQNIAETKNMRLISRNSKRRLNPRPQDGALLMPPGRGLLSDFRKDVAAEMPCKENKPYIAALSSEANR